MKIYHKKNFGTGLFVVLMGAGLIALGLEKGIDFHLGWLIFLCLLFGGRRLLRSLSREYAREDKLEELDERNRYVALRAAQRALQITQAACFILAVSSFAAGIPQHSQTLSGAGLGFSLAVMVSMCAELFTTAYYERRC